MLATRSGAAAWPVAVYPNPAHGAATVQVPALVGAAHIELDLCNALGQVVRRFPTTALPAAGLRLSLDVSGLPEVTQAMVEAGLSEAEIQLVLGENVVRVLSATLPARLPAAQDAR